MSSSIREHLTTLLGPEGVERDPHGLPRAVPESDDAVALVCETARRMGWRFRVEGRASWTPPDAPADLALSTRELNRIVAVHPDDLVATVQAGVPFDALRAQLAEAGMWLAIDPPGRPDRTVGSVVATATAGPLRHGFGPIRDHVLGCTVATGDGRLVDAGGRVVKNVAGYDLTKLHIGGFGGFGVITELHLRLRALPELDLTLVAQGDRDRLTEAGRAVIALGVSVVALELMSPALAARSEWTLAVRLAGTAQGTEAEADRLNRQAGPAWERLDPHRAAGFWSLVGRAPHEAPVVIRGGVVADGLDEAIDLFTGHLGEGLLSAGVAGGGLRWSGEANTEALRQLRHAAANREIPITLERATWPIRAAVGHFGAYREGVGQLVGRLRESFDPGHAISVALEGSP